MERLDELSLKRVCHRCSKRFRQADHDCPYDVDVNNDVKVHVKCTCCEVCEQDCRDMI